MAAFVATVNPRPTLGTGQGPDEAVLVALSTGTGYTATASQEMALLGPVEALEITIVATKVGAAPSVVPSIEAFDAASQTWVTLLTGAAIVANSTVFLLVGPYVTAATNLAAQHLMRSRMRVTVTHGNTDVMQYSISATTS